MEMFCNYFYITYTALVFFSVLLLNVVVVTCEWSRVLSYGDESDEIEYGKMNFALRSITPLLFNFL